MGRLSEVVRRPGFKLGVKKERLAIEVAAQLEAAIAARNITRTELAQKIGKTKAWVSKVLHGRQNMTLGTVVELADALGHDVSVEIALTDAVYEVPVPDQSLPEVLASFPVGEFPTRSIEGFLQ